MTTKYRHLIPFLYLATLLLPSCGGTQKGSVSSNDLDTGFMRDCQNNLEEAKKQLAGIENYQGPRTVEEFLKQVNKLDITIEDGASKASLYRNVHPDAAVRAAADECQQRYSKLYTEISLSKDYYNNLLVIDKNTGDAISQRYIDHMLRAFRRSGVDKDESTREKIRVLREQLTKLGQDFNRNIREDVRNIKLKSTEEMNGLPEDYISAQRPNDKGEIVITTNYPDYLPFMQYAHNDEKRLELYKQFRNRGYPANENVLEQILQLRYQLAQLLGYENYAVYITEDKMIKTADNAKQFINKISKIADNRAKQDMGILLDRLQRIDPYSKRVEDWQKTYLEELIKQEKYQIDSKELRQYFKYKDVRDGIFKLTENLFNVSIKPWSTEVWHPSVEAYEITENNKLIGRFYLDSHPRDGKYKHAAHFGIQTGVKDIQIPISALICNFPGGDNQAGYMEHGQVETFLHEFGHLLHSLFGGQQRWLGISGISTEWDFVEAPSQMLEEWIWDAKTLKTFAKNDSGQTIPDSLVEKMNAGRAFGKGIFIKHQMFYAALSLNYYNRNPDSFDLNSLAIELQNQYSPFRYVDDTHFYASFGHLDGYSAIYYTYMWSLVIASDMFSEFKKYGLQNREIASRYRATILAPGGSRDAADLVREFLGRPYNFKAFENDLNSH